VRAAVGAVKGETEETVFMNAKGGKIRIVTNRTRTEVNVDYQFKKEAEGGADPRQRDEAQIEYEGTEKGMKHRAN